MSESMGEDHRNTSSDGASCPPGCPVSADPALVAEGWTLRFFGDSRMARDAVDTYGDLGFEVRLEPVDTDNMHNECSGCAPVFSRFRMVYTRKKETGAV